MWFRRGALRDPFWVHLFWAGDERGRGHPLCCLLLAEAAAKGAAVGLVEGRIDERIEEGVRVAEPQEDALPDGWQLTGAQWRDELGREEGEPADGEDPDEDPYHDGGLLLLRLPRRVPCGSGGRGRMPGRE